MGSGSGRVEERRVGNVGLCYVDVFSHVESLGRSFYTHFLSR